MDINRISRATLSVLPSTPIAFLEAEGGSMPARARPDQRQEGFAVRLCSSPHARNYQIMLGNAPLAARLRGPIGQSERETMMVETTTPAEGARFPGGIIYPHRAGTTKESRRQDDNSKGNRTRDRLGGSLGGRIQTAPGAVGGAYAYYDPGGDPPSMSQGTGED